MTAEQGSVEWLRERMGMITCSRLKDVLARSSAYAFQLHRERTDPVEPKVYAREPAPLAWGHLNEPRAIAAYELSRDLDVERIGFARHPTMPRFGGSADGLVLDGMIEVKNPYDSGYHLKSLIDGWHKEEAQELQIQGLMEVLDVEWCDWISYDPRLEPSLMSLHVVRRQRDRRMWEERIAPAIVKFEEWIECEGFKDRSEILNGRIPTFF